MSEAYVLIATLQLLIQIQLDYLHFNKWFGDDKNGNIYGNSLIWLIEFNLDAFSVTGTAQLTEAAMASLPLHKWKFWIYYRWWGKGESLEKDSDWE